MKYLLPLILVTSVLSACNSGNNDQANIAPSVDAPAAQNVENTGNTIELAFNVSDDRDDITALSLSATSDNTELFPENNISVNTNASVVTVSLIPAPVLGNATITLNVVDSEGLATNASSTIEVTAESIEFNALVRRVFEQDPNSSPQNLDILNLQEGNISDDFSDLF